MMQSIRTVTDLSGKRVLVRASLNVPIDNGVVRNDFRLRQTLETIEYVRSRGARVIVAGHLSGERTASMAPIFNALKERLPIVFVNDVAGDAARHAVAHLREGQVLLLENLRRSRGEEANELAFAKQLASMGDVYVVDDFSVMHRKHASVVLVPAMMPSYSGFIVDREVTGLQAALKPQSPSLAIIGGAKFQTKEGLLRKCLPLYDKVFVGGAISNDLFKVKGYEVGKSLVSSTESPVKDILSNEKLMLPVDVMVDGPLGKMIKMPTDLSSTETILDAGPETLEMLVPFVAKAKSILWNGPLGNFENGYSEQTERLAKCISESNAISVIGGGDSVAAIDKIKLNMSHIFVSTGGGAMIEFLVQGTLPGLDVLGYRNPKT